jgi:hypothetical protein
MRGWPELVNVSVGESVPNMCALIGYFHQFDALVQALSQ